MTLYQNACRPQHTLVPIVGDYYLCECPAVYRKVGKSWLDPGRMGLLEDLLPLVGGPEGIKKRARKLELVEIRKKSEKASKAA